MCIKPSSEGVMPQVSAKQVENIISDKNGELFIPGAIEDAILSCVDQPIPEVRQASEGLKTSFGDYNAPISVDYSDPLVVDAYSLYYIRRNVLVPRIAVRDIAMNSTLSNFPDRLKVLDLGCGTGSVELGLLEMFTHPPLDQIRVVVDAVDFSQPALDRLKCHLEAANLSQFTVHTFVRDLRDAPRLDELLSKRKPYDLVFAANVFNELEYDISRALIRLLPTHLVKPAVIVVASATRDFIKALQPLLVKEARSAGLFVYYPCAGPNVLTHDCWMWREHDYKCRAIRRKDGEPIGSGAREQLVASWLYLCNQELTIYDDLRVKYPNLKWGVLGIYGKDSTEKDCQICTGDTRIKIPAQRDRIERGALVGFEGNPPEIKRYRNL
jgi:SAM-dependent methyltransferase